MEYGWNDDLIDFYEQMQAFADAHNTPQLRDEIENAEEGTIRGPANAAVRRDVEEHGWLKMCWPVELGGEGKSMWYQFILSEVMGYIGVQLGRGTAAMVGPAIQRFGSEEQKKRYLPGLWSGDIVMALGYSEPNAGTDLASLETRAVRDGDEFVINGQKIWTSGAHNSTHVWLAVRTDPNAPKHRGISMFVVPLGTPGITVRPLWTMSTIRTNETFFEDVRVPADTLIGEEGRGWYIAANALDHERVVLSPLSPSTRRYDDFVRYLKSERPDLLEKPSVRLRLAELKCDVQIQRALRFTNAAIIERGDTPTMEASMSKVWNSEMNYRMTSEFMDILGPYGALSKASGEVAPLEGKIEVGYRGTPVGRFGGGTNEVQRDIIARRGLGLPR